jgi:chitinase
MKSPPKILISLGWSNNDAFLAAQTPAAFANSIADIVRTHNLDGFDIDYEFTDKFDRNQLKVEDMLAVAQHLTTSLNSIKPHREIILTITPAETKGLMPPPTEKRNPSVLQMFTYVMPQTYDHGGDGMTTEEPYKKQLGSFDRIVYGLNSEGYVGDSDDPAKFAKKVKENGAAGIFAAACRPAWK